jgi:hypothetical protein
MDTALIQELVRRRLKDGRLPPVGPPQRRAVAIREIGRFSSGRQCDACDERIGSNQKAVMVSVQGMSFFFHDDCHKVWDAERLALFEKDGEGTRPSPHLLPP